MISGVDVRTMACSVGAWMLKSVLGATLVFAPLAWGERNAAPTSWTQLGNQVEQESGGNGLSVTATHDGALLSCAYQRLVAHATPKGLWLLSTAPEQSTDRLRVMAMSFGRGDERLSFPETGDVHVEGDIASWIRIGIAEEYSVSVDGVRQDFILLEKPAGAGVLYVELSVTGANAEPGTGGAMLTLNESGRRLAYSKLRVTDANGIDIASRMEVSDPARLAILVDDRSAVYPLRIDPTFSDDNWVGIGGILPGLESFSDQVNAVATDSSGNVFIGGKFNVVGGIAATNIAKWDGVTWTNVGLGVSGFGAEVKALEFDALGNMYAGGSFKYAGGVAATNIAMWNGVSWTNVGLGVGGFGAVNALAFDGSGNLYIGGSFTNVSGVAATNVAKWNGSVWTSLGLGIGGSSPDVRAMAMDASDNLYVGGSFTRAGGLAATNIAWWNGASWTNLGLGINSTVKALTVDGSGNLYAGGSFFNRAGTVAATNVAKWNGASWTNLSTGIGQSGVDALAVDAAGNLYAGGQYFTNAGSVAANRVAMWNGTAWTNLGSGVNDRVSGLTVDGSGNVLAVGSFEQAGEVGARHVAKWNGTAWSGLGSGFSDFIEDIVRDAFGNIYVGGKFISAKGGVAANRVARWSGGVWTNLGTGIGNGFVYALAVDGLGNLYAGGDFDEAGGVSVNNIAKWNGSAWTNLGQGINSDFAQVFALTVDNSGHLYAAGSFTNADGVAAENIAKWNGLTWTNLGLGVDSSVSDLIADGLGNIYAGGGFTMAGDVAANGIAKWSGSSWTNLGSGRDGYVIALTFNLSGDLFVAGNFSGNVARWNGTFWQSVGTGLNGEVRDLKVDNSGNVYVGGQLYSVVGNVAVLNGFAWTNLGSGVNKPVNALELDPAGSLYVGGNFYIAGGKPSSYLALWQPVQSGRVLNVSGSLAFGNLPTGTTASTSMSLFSSGAETVIVSSISFPSGFTGGWSGELSPGEQTNIVVTFVPTVPQSYGGVITVNSDATGGNNTIMCSGTGVVPSKVIGVSGTLSFGNVMTGQVTVGTLTVANSGTLPLTINSIDYPVGFTGAWSGVINPNSANNINVSFTPSALQAYAGTITVNSDATSGGSTIACSGTGVAYGALSHFILSTVSSPQSTGVPFFVSITAVDSVGNTVASYSGAVAVRGLAGGGFEDDVEGEINGWTHGGMADLWHISSYRSVSGASSWYCGDDGTHEYVNDMDSWLVSPPVLLNDDATLTYQHWYETESGWDYAYVEISTDDGASYTELTYWDGFGSEWEGQTNDLSAYAGEEVRIRFRFTSDGIIVDGEGWYIDDITIGSPASVSIAPVNADGFTNGVWIGPVTVFQSVSNMYLRVHDGAGHIGTGNIFDVSADGPEVPEDSDNDGLPDWWETANSLNPAVSNALSSNADGDWMTDYEEYVADTNPQSTNSYFPPVTLTNPPLGSISLVVNPTSTARVYHVRWTTNLLTNPQIWVLIPPEQTGSGSAAIFTISNEVPSRIYRTGVRLP